MKSTIFRHMTSSQHAFLALKDYSSIFIDNCTFEGKSQSTKHLGNYATVKGVVFHVHKQTTRIKNTLFKNNYGYEGGMVGVLI